MFNRFFVWLVPDINNNIERSCSNSRRVTTLEKELKTLQARLSNLSLKVMQMDDKAKDTYKLGHDTHSNDWKVWNKKLNEVTQSYSDRINKQNKTIKLQRNHIASLKAALDISGDTNE